MAKGKTALPASGLQSGLVKDQVLEIVSAPATGGSAAKGTLGSVLEIVSAPAQSTAAAAARSTSGNGVVNLPGSGGSLPTTIKVATNTVNGTSGNDTLSTTAANDLLNGLEGDDLITGSDGDDTAFGGTGRDLIFAGNQLDTLFGGDGNDSMGTGAGRDTLYGGTGNDTLYQISGSSHLLEGSVGDDVATFFNFNDPYTSQDFEFSGGAGRDTLLLEAQGRVGGFSYNLTGATDAAVVGADNHKIIFFSQTEVFHFLGGGSNDTVSFLYNGALDARLEGNTGSDTFYAGDGAGANPGGANGVNVTAFGGEGNDTLLASGGADSMVGGVGNDSLNGAAGDDVYFTNYDLGSDSVVGGTAGVTGDLIVAQGSKALVSSWTVTATATGFDAVLNGGANGRVRADGVELLYLSGSNQAETFTMTGDFATGGLAAVTIDMSNGSDVYNGNAATNASFLVDINGGVGNDSIYDSSGSERVLAGSGDDVFVQGRGGAAGDSFTGNSGNDFVQMIEPAGGPGATAMLVYGDNGEDAEGLGLDQISYVTENRNGTSHYVFNKEFLSNDGFTMLQYFAVETFELHGSQSAVDILQVDSQGTVTSLRFFGNGGNDTLFVNPLGGTDNTHITGFGGVGNDSLFGGSASDILDGGDGRDTLMGGFGGDTLQGGSNTLVGGVTFGDSLYGDEGNDLIFYDSADDLIVGGTGHDTLIGTSGQDLIQMTQAKYHAGGSFASFEVVSLGSGNDYYLGPDTPGDFARITGGVSLFGGSGADQISMRGNNFALGNNDSVYGGDGDDVIWGGGGNDTLSGDGGHDNMYGGYGNDTMTGGAGFDVTYVGRNEGNDRILDSEGLVLFWGNEPQGAAPLYNGVDPTEISIQYTGGEVIISMLDESNNVTNTVRFAAGSVQTINLFDFANGDAGNGATPPPLGNRDIWSASWNGTSFNAFTKVVDG